VSRETGAIHDASVDDPLVSPLNATDLAELPPALILTAGCDPLRDDGSRCAEYLTAAGVSARCICYPRAANGFLSMSRLDSSADKGVTEITRELSSLKIKA